MTHLLFRGLLVLVVLGPLDVAGQDNTFVPTPEISPKSEESVIAIPDRPTLRNFPTDLAENSLGLVSRDNFLPLLAGVGAASAAHAVDGSVRDYFTRGDRLGRFEQVGEHAGHQPIVFGAVSGLLTLGQLTGNDRFTRFTYDLAQAELITSLMTFGPETQRRAVATERRKLSFLPIRPHFDRGYGCHNLRASLRDRLQPWRATWRQVLLRHPGWTPASITSATSSAAQRSGTSSREPSQSRASGGFADSNGHRWSLRAHARWGSTSPGSWGNSVPDHPPQASRSLCGRRDRSEKVENRGQIFLDFEANSRSI